MGLHPNSRGIGQSESQGGRWDCSQRVEAQWHRAGAGTQKENDMVDVLEGPLEGLGGERFLQCGGVDGGGLVTYYVLFVIRIPDCVVHIAGITTRPNESWMLQMGRNLIDEESGALASKRYLIVDRDMKYTPQFRKPLKDSRTEVIRLPPRLPNLTAFAERFVRSIKEECLARMIFVGQASLRRAIGEYMTHYHAERNHQGLNNMLILAQPTDAANDDAFIHCRQRLGGMLNYYHRAAA